MNNINELIENLNVEKKVLLNRYENLQKEFSKIILECSPEDIVRLEQHTIYLKISTTARDINEINIQLSTLKIVIKIEGND